MISPDCFRPEDAAEVLALPESDARRRHAAECPRCGALLEEYRLFHDMTGPAEGADSVDAERQLAAAIERELGMAAGTIDGVEGERRARATGGGSRWGWRGGGATRPLLVGVAAAVVMGGVWLWPQLSPPGPSGVLRGTTTARIALEQLEVRDQTLTLKWKSWPGAERYAVRFFTTDLDPLGRSASTTDTMLALPLDSLPAGRPGGTLLVRVVALRSGDEISVSPARAVPAP